MCRKVLPSYQKKIIIIKNMKKIFKNSDDKFAFIVCSIILVPIITSIITFLVMTMGFVVINNNMEKHDTDNYEECYYMDNDESEMLDLTRSDTTMFE